MVEPIAGLFGAAAVVVSVLWIRGLVSKKIMVLCQWGLEPIAWFINRVDN